MIPLLTILGALAAGAWVGWRARGWRCGPLCRPGAFDKAVDAATREAWLRGLHLGTAHGRGELTGPEERTLAEAVAG